MYLFVKHYKIGQFYVQLLQIKAIIKYSDYFWTEERRKEIELASNNISPIHLFSLF